MADAADQADDVTETLIRQGIVRSTFPVAVGDGPGECRECGEHMPRLVIGRCAPCRDGRDSVAVKEGRR